MDLPPNWTRYSTEDGKDYYHNAVTNVTQWDPPVPLAKSEDNVYQPSLDTLDLSSGAPAVGAGKEMNVFGMAPTGNMERDNVPLRDNMQGAGGAQGGNMLFPYLPKFMFCFDLAYLQTFFDVSTEDVTRRTKAALIPQKMATQESILDFRQRPDFWGPFWICTTVVIFLAATGNFGQSFWVEQDVETDWELVSLAAFMMYGALVGVPLLTHLLITCLGQQPSGLPGASSTSVINLQHMICVYGYSFISLLPASLLMIVPSGFLRWVIAILGFACSCIFIKNHLWNDVSSVEAGNSANQQKFKYGLVALLFGTHAVIYFTYRTYFFTSRIGISAT